VRRGGEGKRGESKGRRGMEGVPPCVGMGPRIFNTALHSIFGGLAQMITSGKRTHMQNLVTMRSLGATPHRGEI